MAAQTPRVNGYGRVKSILSGDSVVLIGATEDPNVPFPEKQVTFTGVQAPRFSRSKNQKDEPYAFEAREFLRTLIVDKTVSFNVSKSNEGVGRQYGTLYIDNQSVTDLMLSAGFLTAKEAPNGGRLNADRQALHDLMNEAESNGLGMHNKNEAPEAHVRNIDWNPDVRKVFSMFRGQEVPAVVMQVRDGSVVRCEISGSCRPKPKDAKGKDVMVVSVALAGAKSARCPMSLNYRQNEYNKKKEADSDYDGVPPSEEKPAPFSMEALAFTEQRLLHRDVKLVFQGADKANNLYGVVLLPAGDITSRLLETGLAKFVPWTATMLGDKADKYAAVGASAKAKSIGLHSITGDEVKEEEASKEKFVSKVTFIQSGDQVEVEVGDESVRYSLASIRTKRIKRNENDPLALQAKELMRKKLIGKKVTVQPEYNWTAPSGTVIKYVAIFNGTENMSETLVKEGLAEIIPHRQDEPRAHNYAKLLEFEFDAIQAKLGMHSKNPPKAVEIVDFTNRPRRGVQQTEDEERVARNNSGRAKQYLGTLQRDKGLNGVVEYVMSASRIKMMLPTHSAMIMLLLGGISTPKAGEPFNDEANKFVKDRIIQQNVRIEVEAVDRGDNFIGTVFVDGQNLAVQLLEAGLATIFGFSAQKSPYYTDLLEAETKAKEDKIKVWENYVEQAAVSEGEANLKGLKDVMDVTIVDVSDAVSFYVRLTDDPNVEIVEKGMVEYNANPSTEPLAKPTKGQLIAAKYTDGQWYRVRYDGPAGTEHKVVFVDFGNAEVMPKESLAALPEELRKISPLARNCHLAGLKSPSKNSDYFHDAAVFTNELIMEKTLSAKVEMVGNDNKLHLSLTDKEDESKLTVNQQLLQEGWCRVDERADRKIKGLCKKLHADETIAKIARNNIWEYGDVSDDEEEDVVPSKRYDGRPPSKSAAAAAEEAKK